LVESNETVPCPECSHELVYRDSVKRYGRYYNDKRSAYLIRRLKCTNPSCHRLHRELPDFLVPFRHYVSTVIEECSDGTVGIDDPAFEALPCEKTFHRWKTWLRESKTQIEGLLNSIQAGNGGFIPELKKSVDSLLDHFRKLTDGWLSEIVRCLCNTGCSLPRKSAPDLSCDTDENCLSSPEKEDFHHESKSCTELAGQRGTEKVPDDLAITGRDPGSGKKAGGP
jgi:hypothetical protein